jgi:hypothetical protein
VGRRIKVPIAPLQAKPHDGADGTGGKQPQGTKVVEAIEDAPHGIVGKGLRGDRLPQEELGILMREKLF